MAGPPGSSYLRLVTTLPDFHTTEYSPEEARARREAAIARVKAETGLSEALLSDLVDRFYDRVRVDPLLGPVFDEKIRDWGPHLAQMKLFWASVALGTGTYDGRPMPKHMRLPVDAEHFDRWLALFEATARDLLPAVGAEHVIVRAHRIAHSLELGVANSHGVMLGVGERYRRPPQG